MEGGVVFCEDCTPWRDRKGRPIHIYQLMKIDSLRKVAYDDLPDGTHISTVHLAMRAPCYDRDCKNRMDAFFETMHFPSNDCWRYHNVKEAIDGHKKVKAELIKKLDQERLEAERSLLWWKRISNWVSNLWKA